MGMGFPRRGFPPAATCRRYKFCPPRIMRPSSARSICRGGVQSALYTSMENGMDESPHYNPQTNAYCYDGPSAPNHDSVIIGWDDAYPKESFSIEPEGDGAFICTNSWGEEFGDEGYFYVSYYDTNIGVNNIVYTGIEPADNYDRICQGDLCGWIGQIGYGNEEAWFGNTRSSVAGEHLAAAGFYATDKDTEYEIYLARQLPREPGKHAI